MTRRQDRVCSRVGGRLVDRRRRPRRQPHRHRRSCVRRSAAAWCSVERWRTLSVLPAGDDAVVVEVGDGVTMETPAQPRPDPAHVARHARRRGGDVLTGGAAALIDFGRLVLSAEAVGIARECTEQAAAYAKDRIQFGRPIGMYQAVKHHCANMLVDTELATAAAWDAARAAPPRRRPAGVHRRPGRALAAPAADLCANLNIQVHGGIGFTWEHDAHLYLRRAMAMRSLAGEPSVWRTTCGAGARAGGRSTRAARGPRVPTPRRSAPNWARSSPRCATSNRRSSAGGLPTPGTSPRRGRRRGVASARGRADGDRPGVRAPVSRGRRS